MVTTRSVSYRNTGPKSMAVSGDLDTCNMICALVVRDGKHTKDVFRLKMLKFDHKH